MNGIYKWAGIRLQGRNKFGSLAQRGNRFSIDIDIICNVERIDLEGILDKVIESSHFAEWKLDEHRSYKSGVPKAHYKFSFDTQHQGSGTILLDVLIEDAIYPELAELPVVTKWIETETKTMVTVPTIDAITGDKLTAFAPNTIGIPYFKGKGKQPFSMEICKQLFDLSKLFEHIQDIESVANSFRVIAKRGRGSDDEKQKFAELQRGIRAFDFGFLMTGSFRIDDAVPAAARIAYLAAKILVNDMSPVAYYKGQNIKEMNIEDPDWNFLNKLKRQPDKSSFYYLYRAVILLNANKNESESPGGE